MFCQPEVDTCPHEVRGNEAAEEHAKAAAESTGDATDRWYLREASLALRARATTEARTRGTGSGSHTTLRVVGGIDSPEASPFTPSGKKKWSSLGSTDYQLL